jgi:hypothetical protein
LASAVQSMGWRHLFWGPSRRDFYNALARQGLDQ